MVTWHLFIIKASFPPRRIAHFLTQVHSHRTLLGMPVQRLHIDGDTADMVSATICFTPPAPLIPGQVQQLARTIYALIMVGDKLELVKMAPIMIAPVQQLGIEIHTYPEHVFDITLGLTYDAAVAQRKG
ncbi:hypothetical protein [Schleiferilactobacillus perolens]|jgi:hypothetical protein|nr:hypothetical protein [Schleiferilactobacillus perolens]MCI2171770.1 hypothetical protein [Schleiferilactobacillus perolens]